MALGPRTKPTDPKELYARKCAQTVGGFILDSYEAAQENVERYRRSYEAQGIPFLEGMSDPHGWWREVWTNCAGQEEEALVMRGERGRFFKRPTAPKPWRVS